MPPKVKDDKTFGMKNKNKSSKVQKHIATVQKQQEQAGKSKSDKAKEKEREKAAEAKAAALAKKKMEAELFRPAQVQKVPFGTGELLVLCVYFKAGHCEKGNKCKFSHDRNVERKVEKINLYADQREEKSKDSMDTWDEEKLRNVVTENGRKQKNATDIVCKYFVQAIEDKKYGWFWECPNGGDKCMYRHALPPGFVLKSDKKKQEEAAKKDQISLEQFIEVERHKLKPPLTPVTPETFATWKKNRLEKKAAEQEALEKAKATQRAAGKMTGMTGKDMFEFGGELYEHVDEGEEGDEDWDISRMLARYRDDETTTTAFDPTKGKFVNPRTGEVVDDPEDETVAEVAKKVEDVKVEP
ncbi:cytoplasmic protein [Cryptococcus bacillisporus CA1873]|uniref:Cytoplasmic protein n=2 Tax=Cryptococcus gattii TaxID=552467 RepID=A0A0D0VN49_CRYGA|nr:cytoplasmic protein [Cryptococcus bacillisporus CA1280]KIR63676.1 cytoplasmic protein [Cryptococcus bacillisporus CA1873]|eukprot:KIR63676.1 cytoplasmic protein [Cryptococcus gattii CA1873]